MFDIFFFHLYGYMAVERAFEINKKRFASGKTVLIVTYTKLVPRLFYTLRLNQF